MHFGYNTKLEEQLGAAYQWQTFANQYLLIDETQIDDACFDNTQAIDLGFAHRRHWVLLPLTAKLNTCTNKESALPVYCYTAVN